MYCYLNEQQNLCLNGTFLKLQELLTGNWNKKLIYYLHVIKETLFRVGVDGDKVGVTSRNTHQEQQTQDIAQHSIFTAFIWKKYTFI